MIALDAVTPLSAIPQKKKPVKMQTGGDPIEKLAEGPPEDINTLPRFEGFEPGPNQFELRTEEEVISSEPEVYTNPRELMGEYFPMPTIPGPIPSEPDVVQAPAMDRATEGTVMDKEFYYMPNIFPQAVYPRDPDPGIFVRPPQNMPQQGGIPQLLNTGLQNNGIMDIVEKLKITKPQYDI
jgi:hypothetical protein